MDRMALMESLERAGEFEEALGRYTARCPASLYQPHEAGQLQFHLARHMIRALFPGNGFGKTTAMAQEFHAWCTHSYRWGLTPRWPVVCIWWAPQLDQFELLRQQIETEVVGDQAVWVGSKNRYEYPDGSVWYILSGERSWTSVQGINPDLVGFDEQPKLSLWREMMMRRRGKRKTRYLVAATATKGISWMFDNIYKVWLDHHEGVGADIDSAMDSQSHSKIWCWPKGGIDDNPGADAEDRLHYHTTTWSSPKEKQVRLHGGFEDWTGDPIFNPEAIDRMRAMSERLMKRIEGPRRGMIAVKEAA